MTCLQLKAAAFESTRPLGQQSERADISAWGMGSSLCSFRGWQCDCSYSHRGDNLSPVLRAKKRCSLTSNSRVKAKLGFGPALKRTWRREKIKLDCEAKYEVETTPLYALRHTKSLK